MKHTQTHRNTDTKKHRHTDTNKQRNKETQKHRHTDTQTHRHTDTQTHRHTMFALQSQIAGAKVVSKVVANKQQRSTVVSARMTSSRKKARSRSSPPMTMPSGTSSSPRVLPEWNLKPSLARRSSRLTSRSRRTTSRSTTPRSTPSRWSSPKRNDALNVNFLFIL